MNILLITNTFPTPSRPRQGAFNQVLASALSSRHDMRVIAPIPWTQLPWSPWMRRRNVAAEGTPAMHPTYYYPPGMLRTHHHHFYWRSVVGSIKRLEREFRPDVVLGYFLHPDGAAAVRTAEHFRVPSIMISGGSDLKLLPNQPGRRTAVMRVLQRADRLVVVSRELAGHAIGLGAAESKIDVVYRGIDRACFHPRDRAVARGTCGFDADAIVVLWAGRFEEVKHPAMLLYAALRWRSLWRNRLRVIMAGDGSLRHRLVQLRSQLGLSDTVEFVGDLTQHDLALRYNAADVTVVTSHSEGIPNVLLESIACGTPFVATDVGGISEIATPGIDRLVQDGDVEGLADAVVQQVQSGSASQRRAFVPSDSAGMAAQIEAVIEHAISGQPPLRNPKAIPAPIQVGARPQQVLHEASQ